MARDFTFILLAAGRGRRLGPLSLTLPKPLLPTGDGTPLIVQTLRNAEEAATVGRAVVVGGYMADALESELATAGLRLPVTILRNPAYATTGPLQSLWLARETFGEGDCFVANGDTLYRPEVFDRMAGSPEGVHLGVSDGPGGDDEVRVLLDTDDRVVAVGKSLGDARGGRLFVSSGLAAFVGPEPRATARAVLEGLACAEEGRGRIWHTLLDRLAAEGLVGVRKLPAVGWFEVDTRTDHDELRGRRL